MLMFINLVKGCAIFVNVTVRHVVKAILEFTYVVVLLKVVVDGLT